jgi:hypothetical protein
MMTESPKNLISEPEQQEGQEAAMAEYIKEVITEARDQLLADRDAQIAAANAPLDRERAELEAEYRALGEASRNLAELLPAKARIAQAEHDRLLLAGDREGADLKLAEQKEAERAPEGMLARQREIAEHLAEIEEKKKAVARRVFQRWHANLQQLIRATEHVLFIELLEGSLSEFYRFQERYGLGATAEKPHSHLVQNSLVSNLTAPERSEEWKAGTKWYSGRDRR